MTALLWKKKKKRKINGINHSGSCCSIRCSELQFQLLIHVNHKQKCPKMGQVFISNQTTKIYWRHLFLFCVLLLHFKHCSVVIRNRAISHAFIFTQRIYVDFHRNRERLNFSSAAAQEQPDHSLFFYSLVLNPSLANTEGFLGPSAPGHALPPNLC